MSWADDIDRAMTRGNSPYSFADLFDWLRAGRAYFCATKRMNASLWFKDDGTCEIGHVAGQWNQACARWIYARCWSEAQRRGCDKIEINGRAGWSRFLKMKGWEYERGR